MSIELGHSRGARPRCVKQKLRRWPERVEDKSLGIQAALQAPVYTTGKQDKIYFPGALSRPCTTSKTHFFPDVVSVFLSEAVSSIAEQTDIHHYICLYC